MKKVLKIVTNKYFLTGVTFVVWSMFFDQNDWFTLREKQKELDNVKSSITFLNAEINQMTAERNTLTDSTDRRRLEKYARENYRMKKENEDVYVIDNNGK